MTNEGHYSSISLYKNLMNEIVAEETNLSHSIHWL